MKTQTKIDLISGIILGIFLVVLCYIFWVGMGKEIERKEALSDYYCENYGYCK